MRQHRFVWGARTYVMGVINATPDSFSGDGINRDTQAAVDKALSFAAAGCDIIDIGGESTRPGHEPVPEEEEIARVIPVLRAVRAAVDTPLSIDTFKPKVALRALDAGADMLNCVWGAVPGIVEAAKLFNAPLVLMHNRAAPPYAADCFGDAIESLQRATAQAERAGVSRESIIVDPGIGFGKTAAQSIEVLSRLGELVARLPYPLLVGVSRKSFIASITGLAVGDRTYATGAVLALAVAAGADIVRIHDVEQLTPAVRVADALCRRPTAPAMPCGSATTSVPAAAP
jgi:dihydropteroate synthase